MVFYRTGPGPRIGTEGVWTSGNVETISQQLNQPASSYSASSYGTSTTGTGTGTGTSSGQGNKYPSVSGLGTGSSSGPASNYSVNTSTGTSTHTTPPPIEGTPPSVELPPSTYNQVVSQIPSVTKQLQGLAPATETTTTPTGVAHLWIGWKIEPWEEDIIQKFIEAFEHGKHVHRPPIELPQMGGVLAPIPGAPAPGAPVTILPPQGAGNQQQLTV
jgi:hypothetical protein